MQRNIDLANKISKEPEKDWASLIEEYNLTSVFAPIYRIKTAIKEKNLIASFLVFSLDPDSKKINYSKDRYDDKISIMSGIGLNVEKKLIQEILFLQNNLFIDSYGLFLEELKDWRWNGVYTSLEYSSKMFRFVNQNTDEEKSWDKLTKDGVTKTLTEDYNIDTIGKVNIQKSDLLKRAISAREDADKILASIKKDMMLTDHGTQGDFQFEFSETAKKKTDIMSWRQFIRDKKEKESLNSLPG